MRRQGDRQVFASGRTEAKRNIFHLRIGQITMDLISNQQQPDICAQLCRFVKVLPGSTVCRLDCADCTGSSALFGGSASFDSQIVKINPIPFSSDHRPTDSSSTRQPLFTMELKKYCRPRHHQNLFPPVCSICDYAGDCRAPPQYRITASLFRYSL